MFKPFEHYKRYLQSENFIIIPCKRIISVAFHIQALHLYSRRYPVISGYFFQREVTNLFFETFLITCLQVLILAFEHRVTESTITFV